MKWHLCTPEGVSSRTTRAPDIATARTNFRLVRPGWFIASDPSYQLGFTKSQAPELCSKCFRNPPAAGGRKCETCRTRDKKTASVANAKRPERNQLTPEQKRKKAATQNARRSIQGTILRGIIARRVRRTANEA